MTYSFIIHRYLYLNLYLRYSINIHYFSICHFNFHSLSFNYLVQFSSRFYILQVSNFFYLFAFLVISLFLFRSKFDLFLFTFKVNYCDFVIIFLFHYFVQQIFLNVEDFRLQNYLCLKLYFIRESHFLFLFLRTHDEKQGYYLIQNDLKKIDFFN